MIPAAETAFGNCRDNACAESFFKTLKRELETLDGKHAAGEVRQSLYILRHIQSVFVCILYRTMLSLICLI